LIGGGGFFALGPQNGFEGPSWDQCFFFFFFFFFFSLQFCDVMKMAIIHKKILPNLANIQDIKAKNLKHPSISISVATHQPETYSTSLAFVCLILFL
jgi:hypothetical protein